MSENCKKCNPENGECDFCPNSSVGLINIKNNGGPCESDNKPDIDLYDPVLSDDLYEY